MASAAIRRLGTEQKNMMDPSQRHPDYFAQPLDENIFEWHFTIRGPYYCTPRAKEPCSPTNAPSISTNMEGLSSGHETNKKEETTGKEEVNTENAAAPSPLTTTIEVKGSDSLTASAASPLISATTPPTTHANNSTSSSVPASSAEPGELSPSEIFSQLDVFHEPGEALLGYERGVYHGALVFSYKYPFEPPDIMFFTPQGRFECNTKICSTISSFHKEHWQPTYNIGFILQSLREFMRMEDEEGVGALHKNCVSRMQKAEYAKKSWQFRCSKCKSHAADIYRTYMHPYISKTMNAPSLPPHSPSTHTHSGVTAAPLADPPVPSRTALSSPIHLSSQTVTDASVKKEEQTKKTEEMAVTNKEGETVKLLRSADASLSTFSPTSQTEGPFPVHDTKEVETPHTDSTEEGRERNATVGVQIVLKRADMLRRARRQENQKEREEERKEKAVEERFSITTFSEEGSAIAQPSLLPTAGVPTVTTVSSMASTSASSPSLSALHFFPSLSSLSHSPSSAPKTGEANPLPSLSEGVSISRRDANKDDDCSHPANLITTTNEVSPFVGLDGPTSICSPYHENMKKKEEDAAPLLSYVQDRSGSSGTENANPRPFYVESSSPLPSTLPHPSSWSPKVGTTMRRRGGVPQPDTTPTCISQPLSSMPSVLEEENERKRNTKEVPVTSTGDAMSTAPPVATTNGATTSIFANLDEDDDDELVDVNEGSSTILFYLPFPWGFLRKTRLEEKGSNHPYGESHSSTAASVAPAPPQESSSILFTASSSVSPPATKKKKMEWNEKGIPITVGMVDRCASMLFLIILVSSVRRSASFLLELFFACLLSI